MLEHYRPGEGITTMSIAQDTTVDLTGMVTRAIHGITTGIAPHAGRMENEEYKCNVPVYLRNRGGLPGDELAAILATDRPELGIESEDDLYQALAEGSRQRRDAEYETGSRGEITMEKTTGFDPIEATQALQEFEFAMQLMDPAIVEQFRAAWKASYLRCGHKALARLLVTGNVDKSIKGIQKRAAALN